MVVGRRNDRNNNANRFLSGWDNGMNERDNAAITNTILSDWDDAHPDDPSTVKPPVSTKPARKRPNIRKSKTGPKKHDTPAKGIDASNHEDTVTVDDASSTTAIIDDEHSMGMDGDNASTAPDDTNTTAGIDADENTDVNTDNEPVDIVEDFTGDGNHDDDGNEVIDATGLIDEDYDSLIDYGDEGTDDDHGILSINDHDDAGLYADEPSSNAPVNDPHLDEPIMVQSDAGPYGGSTVGGDSKHGPTPHSNRPMHRPTESKDALESLFDSYEDDLAEIEMMKRINHANSPIGKLQKVHSSLVDNGVRSSGVPSISGDAPMMGMGQDDRGPTDDDVDTMPQYHDADDGMMESPWSDDDESTHSHVGDYCPVDEDEPVMYDPYSDDDDHDADNDQRGHDEPSIDINNRYDAPTDEDDGPIGRNIINSIDEGDSFNNLGPDYDDDAMEEEPHGPIDDTGGLHRDTADDHKESHHDAGPGGDSVPDDGGTGEHADSKDSDDDKGTLGSLLKGGLPFKERMKSLLSQIKSEMHGGDEPSSVDDSPHDMAPKTKGHAREQKPKGNGETNDGNGNGFSWSSFVSLVKSPRKLLAMVKRVRRATWVALTVSITLVTLWGSSNIPAMVNKGGVTDTAVDEGTVSLVGASWSDGKARITMRNGSDMIAHVSGTAEVRSWAPTANPLTWMSARVTATCSVPSTDVDPGATVTVYATCGHTTGTWHRVRAKLEYE